MLSALLLRNPVDVEVGLVWDRGDGLVGLGLTNAQNGSRRGAEGVK